MQEHALLYPMCAMVILTFTVLIMLFRTRVRLAREGQIDASYFKIYQGATEPDTAAKLSRHFTNIFEAPVLFYVACLAAIVTHQVTLLFYLLAWGYVIVRAVHAYIHTGSNKLQWRIAAYFSSWFVLLLMWLHLVIYVAVIAET